MGEARRSDAPTRGDGDAGSIDGRNESARRRLDDRGMESEFLLLNSS